MSTAPWAPGAHVDGDATRFAVFSTTAKKVEVRLFDAAREAIRTEPLEALGGGRFEGRVAGVADGALYKIVLDGDEVPDPYARFLPDGVHGVARVEAHAIEPPLEAPRPLDAWVIYEIHIGAFSGTFRGAIERLDALVTLGITAIELMPLSAFPGDRGWGYDGVALSAPYAGYGTPDDLRALVRAAHARGLAVVLDVVYNHFGPSGNYLARYAPEYFTDAVQTPWGAAPDFTHAPMRELVLDNVRHWFDDIGIDALRLDATHAIVDASTPHVLRAIADEAHARGRLVFFEDERNDPTMVTEHGADAIWADDFHHAVHVLLTGERDGYYAAYPPTVEALARTIARGWAFEGEPYAPWGGKPRGTPAVGVLRPAQLVYCIQNHDQVGNRADGARLSHAVELDAYIAASVLLLFLPATPLLFMGQEWGARSPFPFFSNHGGELGASISKGRKRELASFAAFADGRREIPDPEDSATFVASKVQWQERQRAPHSRVLAAYQAMLALRRTDEVLSARASFGDLTAHAEGDLLVVTRAHGVAARRLVVSFGRSAVRVGNRDDKVVFATHALEAGVLPAKGAVIFSGSATARE
jgi:maltooligosyltrehalose trehalohydrolase